MHNGRFIEEEMHRFEAEITQQHNNFMRPRPPSHMFMPPQMRGMNPHGHHMPPRPPHFMGPPGLGPPGMPMTRLPMGHMGGPVTITSQPVIAAPPKPATISAPPQTSKRKAGEDDDDDIMATLKKYEAEAKKDTTTTKGKKSAGLTPSQVVQPQRKAAQMAEAAKNSTTSTVNRVSAAPPPPPAFKGPTAPPGAPPQQGAKAGGAQSSGEEPPKKSKKMNKRIIRTGGGQIWEDETLKEWDPNDFRLFCGDLGNDVTDEVLIRTFSRYPSFNRAKVVRDKKTNKTKGFGFVSFKDPMDFTRAIRELNGKYVGSRPIKLRKSNWKDRNIEVVKQKQKVKQQMGYKF